MRQVLFIVKSSEFSSILLNRHIMIITLKTKKNNERVDHTNASGFK